MKTGPITVSAVVVGLTRYGEGHGIVNLLTREEGLQRAFAPSVGRSKRRFGGGFEPGTRLQVVLSSSPGRELASIKESSVVGGLRGALRSDLTAMLRMGWMLDLSRSLLGEAQPTPESYDLLCEGVEALDEARLPPWGLAAFELAALSAFGAEPRFDACASCGTRPRAQGSRFSPSKGGLACPKCHPGWEPDDVVLERRTLEVLCCLARAGSPLEMLESAGRIPDAPALVEQARTALCRCTRNLMGRPLKSRELLDRLADGCPTEPPRE